MSPIFVGVVCGIYGTEIRTGKGKGTTGGKFKVEEIIFAEFEPQMKLEKLNDDRYLQFTIVFHQRSVFDLVWNPNCH
jgi:hypothetical protein